MSRSMMRRAAAALGLVLGAGCAHCDTCDKVPVPCTGPGCSAGLQVVAPAGPMVAAPIAVPAGTPGPFTPTAPAFAGPANDAATGTGTTPTFTTPPLPNLPADAPSPPPAGAVAPEKP